MNVGRLWPVTDIITFIPTEEGHVEEKDEEEAVEVDEVAEVEEGACALVAIAELVDRPNLVSFMVISKSFARSWHEMELVTRLCWAADAALVSQSFPAEDYYWSIK